MAHAKDHPKKATKKPQDPQGHCHECGEPAVDADGFCEAHGGN